MAAETLYRAMSIDDFKTFTRTRRVLPSTETFTSPNPHYSAGYSGVLVKFSLRPGTVANLRSIGVRAHGRANQLLLPDMPVVKPRWGYRNALFKLERGNQNIGLGRGRALDIFNDSIVGFEVIPRHRLPLTP